ncbi:MAG: hypothetical protein GY866_07485 [Proteobacteria bacterium]|nr:hypothetical protein [Pseudomonadota bacterium]
MKFKLNTHKSNILDVDERYENLRYPSSLLGDQGYNVRPVPNGKLALSGEQAISPYLRVGSKITWHSVGKMSSLYGTFADSLCQVIFVRSLWSQIESYIERRSDVLFSHGICPECMEEM